MSDTFTLDGRHPPRVRRWFQDSGPIIAVLTPPTGGVVRVHRNGHPDLCYSNADERLTCREAIEAAAATETRPERTKAYQLALAQLDEDATWEGNLF